jgi:hypothetical protein
MDISTDQELLEKARAVVGEEKKAAVQIVDLLREMDRRLLYLKMDCSSLQELCEKKLGYSGPAAGRRVAAMRLVKELPEAREMLNEGKLSLDTMQALRSHFRKKKPSMDYGNEKMRPYLQQ